MMQQQPNPDPAPVLRNGDFVRVARDADFRAGQDGMVVSPQDADGVVGMVFVYDRYGEAIRVPCLTGGTRHAASEGTEAWQVSELDLSTLER